MKTNEYMEQTEQYVLHTYNRFPARDRLHGEGVHLYDTDGKAYLTLRQVSRYMRSATAMTIIKSSERPGGQSHPCFQPVLQCSDGLRGRKAGEGIRHG